MKTHGKDTLRATHGGQANPNYLCVLPQLETNAMAGGSRGLNGGANFEGGVKDPNGEDGGPEIRGGEDTYASRGHPSG